MIGQSEQRALDGADILTQLDIIATNITSLPSPQVDYAVQISNGINNTIIPEADIQRLIGEANGSVDTAMKTLSLAQNARYTICMVCFTILHVQCETSGQKTF